MTIRRLQGWALVLSAICLLLGSFLPASNASHVIAIVGTVLFVLGVPAIQALQPERTIGWIGILLLEIAALIALLFQLGMLASSPLALTSAIIGMLGRVIIGYLTARRSGFPAWPGWALIL